MKESQRLRDAFKYLFQEELDYIYEITESLPDNPVIVNIGAGAGTSGLAFLEAREDSKVFTIDITADDDPYGTLLAEELSAKIIGVWDRLTQIHGDSCEVGQLWNGGEIDLVFIDGNHSYEGCMCDMETWSALLKPGGYMLVHDYDKDRVFDALGEHDPKDYPHPHSLLGVDKAVSEWIDMESMEFVGTVATIAIFRD